MKKGPVLLVGPPVNFQPWSQNDLLVIRNWLEDRHGLIGVVHIPAELGTCNYPGYVYLNVGMA